MVNLIIERLNEEGGAFVFFIAGVKGKLYLVTAASVT
jgi:hypothetical protein